MIERCAALEPLHSAWVDGELRVGERARLAAHLQRCARCRASVHQLRVTQTMLRSLPQRRLAAEVATPEGSPHSRRSRSVAVVQRALVRSTLALLVAVVALTGAALAVGGPEQQEPQVAVPVDVYVADHLVRTVGGPVSTPALVQAKP